MTTQARKEHDFLTVDAASPLHEAGVVGSSFLREPVNHLIRFHFAKNEETLRAAGEGLLLIRDFVG